jgi:uncharacterized protein
VNFQLNILIYSVILVGIGVATCGIGFIVTGPLLFILAVYAMIMSVIAGLNANGGAKYRYPYTFRLIK